MIEVFFAFTVIYVAYVLYEVFKSLSASTPQRQRPPVSGDQPIIRPSETVAPTPSDVDTPARTAPATERADKAEEPRGAQLLNPATGETAPVPNNYRFAKRWIKEAMVAEGLLDRVYRNSELEGMVSRKVKDALERFKSIEKYHA